MGRPKVPLIAKREVLELALKIIDEEGLAALSIRRLAAECEVNGASFYYHFTNKDEIVVGAASLALDSLRVPRDSGENWQEWLVRNTEMYHAALLEHPELITVLLKRGRLKIGLRRVEETFVRLEAQGVPGGAVLAMMQSLELFAIGAALFQSYDEHADEPSELAEEQFPVLLDARRQRHRTIQDTFAIGCRAIIAGIVEEFGLEYGEHLAP